MQQAAQQPPVRPHPGVRGNDAQIEGLLAGERCKLHIEALEHLVQGKDGDVGLEPARVEPRDLDENAQDLLDRLQRGIDVAGQRRLLAALRALDQARHVEPRRVERLQHVVTGRRQEARLVEVGLVGLALGDRQGLIDLGQLGGALPDAPLQRLVGSRQGLRRLDALGDVGIGGDDAALRHGARPDLEDALAAVEVLLECLVRHGQLHEPVGDELVDVARAEVAALGAGAQDPVERCADPAELGGEVEQLAELAVPADEVHVLVEHAEPMPHLIERGLQEIAIVLQRLGSIIEQAQCGLAAGVAAAQQQRQDQPRRRRPDGAGEQMLGEAQQMDVGFGLRGDRSIAAFRELGERPLRALGSQIAGNCMLQVAGSDGCTPQPERRRHRRATQIAQHEHLGLQALDRLGSLQQGRDHEHRHVGGHAPQHAVRQLVHLQVEQGRAATGSSARRGPRS